MREQKWGTNEIALADNSTEPLQSTEPAKKNPPNMK